nr:hypothetical protein [Tanacetum cinerariifolium]
MTRLTDKAILPGADNRPPMLEKDMYDSWKSRLELYMLSRQHGRMILESIENGSLLWPTVEENGVTRLKKYSELSTTEAIQADCDVKATNIILQGLSPEFYALVNTKFLNTLPPEWSKFVTDVKLVRDLHTTNVNQLHAYLGQHEYHVNELLGIKSSKAFPLLVIKIPLLDYFATISAKEFPLLSCLVSPAKEFTMLDEDKDYSQSKMNYSQSKTCVSYSWNVSCD